MRDERDDVVTARLWSVLSSSGAVSGGDDGPPALPSSRPPPPQPSAPSSSPPSDLSASGPFDDRSPVAWSDLVPSWPEDVQLDADGPARPVVTPSSTAPIDPSAWAAVRPAWRSSRAASHPYSRAAALSGTDGDPAARWDSAALSTDPAPPSFDPTPRASEPESARLSGFQPSGTTDRPSMGGAFGSDRGRLAAFDPGRRGVKALAGVAVVVVLVAAFLAWRARPHVDSVPPAPVAEAPALPDDAPPAVASARPEVVVAVEGKVGRPGVVRLPAGSRVADALAAAGGARSGVDVSLLNMARKVVDGELILVGVTPPPGTTVAAGPAGPAPGGAPAGPVNLNTATVAELDALPGVGPVLAQRILDARTAQGGFRAVSDLRKVEGIGASRYDQLKDLVTV